MAQLNGQVDDELAQQVQEDPQFLQLIQQNPDLMAQIQQNPEMLRQLYQDYIGQGQMADEQMAQAEALRGQQAPQGLQAGGQFVASSPLSHLANTGSRGIGAWQGRQALAEKKRLSDDKTQGVQSVVKGMNPLSQALRN
jgi:hypothetical protein